MEIEESPYFIKLAPGLSVLRQRSDLALPSKEQKALGRKAGVQRICSTAMFPSRKKRETFPLQMKWDSRRPRAARYPMEGTSILFQSLFAAWWKPLTAAKSSLVSGQSKGRGEIPSNEAAHYPRKWKTLFLLWPRVISWAPVKTAVCCEDNILPSYIHSTKVYWIESPEFQTFTSLSCCYYF